MKVLITGGFGYLGGRLGQHLSGLGGFEVRLGSRQERIAPPWLPRAQAVRTRWDFDAELEAACAGADAVVHLAGMNAQNCMDDPVAALKINGLATARLVRAAQKAAVKRFVYVSTAHVYGAPLAGVITEQTCAAPTHPYASSHRAGEDAVLDAARAGGIDSVVVRLSNTFGAPAHRDADCWMLLINDLCRQSVQARRMVLKTSGLQRRDFIALHDVCRALAHLLGLPSRNGRFDIVNIGSGTSATVWEAAGRVRERCAATLGYVPELERVPPQPGENGAELEYRIEALRSLGFEPSPDGDAEIDGLLRFCARAFA